MEEGRRGFVENSNIIFVAVGKELRNYRSTLRWVLQNFWGMEICIIYVYVPSQTIPIPTGGEIPATQLGEHDLAENREQERLEMLQITDYYTDTIGNITGGNPTVISHDANSIEEGIVEVITLYRARRLVMGAATDTGYSREMTEPTSTKSKYVRQHAPDFCQIQFICKGELISTREAAETSNLDFEQTPSVVLDINEPDTRVESSGYDNLYDQLEQAISRTGYSIRRQKTEIEEICQKYLAKRLCDLELERDKALEEAEQLRKQHAEKPSTPKSFSYFSTSDVKNATNNFDTLIGNGGYGSIYKGLLGDTEVAIKVPHPDGKQGHLEFEREIDALSNLRHPNLVTLVGACLESRALIYGYLHGGSLKDRLNCKNNSPPLLWQSRIRIATELCSVVDFLHSNAHNSIIHGDLKPDNILLDENLVCKLSDFGICHLSSRTAENSTEQYTSFFTEPRGTFFHMDPEFLTTGVLSRKSDVYSFGVILLCLLTGLPAKGIANEVTDALDSYNLKSILDPSAGEWPSVYTEELARMALSCCEMTKRDRPDLVKVLRFLKLIRASSIGLSTHQWVGDDEPPTYFLCPIFQEIMEDPHFASDGFTYEKKAIQGWLELGRDSSPMTNISLQDSNIVPNRALHSAIQEWQQQNHTTAQ